MSSPALSVEGMGSLALLGKREMAPFQRRSVTKEQNLPSIPAEASGWCTARQPYLDLPMGAALPQARGTASTDRESKGVDISYPHMSKQCHEPKELVRCTAAILSLHTSKPDPTQPSVMLPLFLEYLPRIN